MSESAAVCEDVTIGVAGCWGVGLDRRAEGRVQSPGLLHGD